MASPDRIDFRIHMIAAIFVNFSRGNRLYEANLAGKSGRGLIKSYARQGYARLFRGLWPHFNKTLPCACKAS
jgi:hypothetical protein